MCYIFIIITILLQQQNLIFVLISTSLCVSETITHFYYYNYQRVLAINPERNDFLSILLILYMRDEKDQVHYRNFSEESINHLIKLGIYLMENMS